MLNTTSPRVVEAEIHHSIYYADKFCYACSNFMSLLVEEFKQEK